MLSRKLVKCLQEFNLGNPDCITNRKQNLTQPNRQKCKNQAGTESLNEQTAEPMRVDEQLTVPTKSHSKKKTS